MYIKQPKIKLTVEIDQSYYLDDEDYPGLVACEFDNRDALARLLDGGYYEVKITVEELEKD